jgi:hypothetical protein
VKFQIGFCSFKQLAWSSYEFWCFCRPHTHIHTRERERDDIYSTKFVHFLRRNLFFSISQNWKK